MFKFLISPIIVVIFLPMERINRIKEVLVIQGKTQKWFAEQLSKSATAVTSFCNNKSQHHLTDLKRIAAVLDIDIKDLLVSKKRKPAP
jgi:transcriptional regulator with XRE-family HTH domain